MFRRNVLAIFAIFLVSALLCAPSWADELKTLSGKTISGTLEKITGSEITLLTNDGSVATPLDKALDLNVRAVRGTAEKYIEVQLLDDSILRCTKVSFGAKEIRLELTSGAAIKVPIAALVSMLRDADDPDIRKQWNRLIKTKVRGDRIFILSKGDLNSISGLYGEVDEKDGSNKFKGDKTEEVDIKLDRLKA